MHKSGFIVLGGVLESENRYLPFVNSPVRAGFPSPADDYLETKLDLTEHLIQHPSSTYYIRAVGDSMIEYGIFSGDLLIVDRSLEPKISDIVIVAIDGELTCKQLAYMPNSLCLVSGNPEYPTIPLEDKDVHIWGVVIHAIHSLRGRS
ncbi:translesion error-prone DNA polymerase V autoproteolytic subunit [Entomomonas sp. E2T0]|uniref:LexA family protein n=1 Tax=Entomomonas sp. E2T0 TaxID=2930213 RepID=UPI0022282450|nr:translesion error-prone DNA polymerase V autoproteolytic subunit [Entomomonas sp. E2T0]UYZ83679.1 translesion error-prone DNA polymerase V autoproteolytic subunit [Entomomonas sp. E2T0]